MLSKIFLLAAVFASSSSSTPLPSSSITPVSLRECYISTYSPSLIVPLAEYLSTVPLTTIPVNMGAATFRQTINGTCLQARVYNWSCDNVLNVTGPGIANAVASIAEQCDGRKYSTGETTGPVGFGYYKDLETGYEYTKHLWVVTGGCVDRHLMSACSPGA